MNIDTKYIQILLDSYLDVEMFEYEDLYIHGKLSEKTDEAIAVVEKNSHCNLPLYGLLKLKKYIESDE